MHRDDQPFAVLLPLQDMQQHHDLSTANEGQARFEVFRQLRSALQSRATHNEKTPGTCDARRFAVRPLIR